MNNILQALRILTILPFGEETSLKEEDSEGIVSSFSFCGTIIAIISISIIIALRYLKSISQINSIMTPLFEALLLTTITTVITGAFHLDGLADSFDGLGSRRGREGALEIMKDSHIGTYGVCALILTILLKVIILASFPQKIILWVFAAAIIASRFAITISCSIGSYARKKDEGLGGYFIENCRTNRPIYVGLIIPVIYIILGLWTIGLLRSVIAYASASLLAIILTRYFTKKLGGITGDTLGATSELTEILVLFSLFCSI